MADAPPLVQEFQGSVRDGPSEESQTTIYAVVHTLKATVGTKYAMHVDVIAAPNNGSKSILL